MWILALAMVSVLAASALTAVFVARKRRWRRQWLTYRLRDFFGVSAATEIQVSQRSFPALSAPDLMAGLDAWLGEQAKSSEVMGVPLGETMFSSTTIGALMAPKADSWLLTSAVDSQTYAVGDGRTVDCPLHAVWLVTLDDAKAVVLWTTATTHSRGEFQTRINLEIGVQRDSPGAECASRLFERVEQAVNESRSYRGKVLSLENTDDYSGNAGGVKVHRLKQVTRDQLVLRQDTLVLLERNLLRFVEQRESLRRVGMPTKKGLLLYGPPGTGKTHTIHYLIGALQSHTTLLMTAEQMGALAEYMALARLLEPCIVVIEDVDLIAQDRANSDACRQSLLNRLLNEMDGLREDADIIFILTTNRPEALEAALAARPGRIDQVVEFPLPDAACREQLVRLYACGAAIGDDVVQAAVRATDGVSASFIKELMRRALQFHLECNSTATPARILRNDVDQALEEMLWTGGALNRRLLGASEVEFPDPG